MDIGLSMVPDKERPRSYVFSERDWAQQREEMEELKASLRELAANTEHLAKLDRLETIDNNISQVRNDIATVKSEIADVRVNLVGPATGLDRLPIKSVEYLQTVYRIIIVALVGVIVSILIGKHVGWLEAVTK